MKMNNTDYCDCKLMTLCSQHNLIYDTCLIISQKVSTEQTQFGLIIAEQKWCLSLQNILVNP